MKQSNIIKNLIVGTLLVFGLAGCAGGGSLGPTGVKWNKTDNCGPETVILDNGTVIKCMTHESARIYYETKSSSDAKKARYIAIQDTKGDAAAQVLLAFESQKKDGVNIQREMKWDERLLPWVDRIIRIADPFDIWDRSNNSSSKNANILALEGDNNAIIIGDTKTEFGRDGSVLNQDITYDYDTETNNTQVKSPNGYNGEPYVTNTELIRE